MITFLRLLGLACIVVACLTLQLASNDTLAALGVCCLIGFCVMGFGLCVMAGQVSDQDLDEANGGFPDCPFPPPPPARSRIKWDVAIDHPDDLEGKN